MEDDEILETFTSEEKNDLEQIDEESEEEED